MVRQQRELVRNIGNFARFLETTCFSYGTVLNHFLQDYPEAVPYLVYRGMERLKVGPVACIPAEQFLLELTPEEKTRPTGAHR